MSCIDPSVPVPKDPEGRNIFKYDLVNQLEQAEILRQLPGQYEFLSLPAGLTFEDVTFAGDGKSVTVAILGGELYQDYFATFRYQTSLNRHDDLSIWLRIQDK